MERTGYARLDADYLVQVRPHLTDREARVYEAVILLCDGWDRPTTTASVASITRLHIDHVRKAMRSLEQLKLIDCTWRGARTSPNGHRSVVILRDHAATLEVMRALGRIGPELGGRPLAETARALGRNSPELAAAMGRNGPKTLGRNGPKTLGQIGPKTLGQIGPEHLTRSDPDPSIPPSRPSLAASEPESPDADRERGREGSERLDEVPLDLIELCRDLWNSNEVPLRAARRYLAKLLPVGHPTASATEIARYLRAVAKSHRVQTAGCPIAVACMPEEFAGWLERHRTQQQARPARASPGRPEVSLSRQELGRRSAAFTAQLARCLPDNRHIQESLNRAHEASQEIQSDVGT